MAPELLSDTDWLAPFVGQVVVVDLAEFFVIIGTLARLTSDGVVFADADLHDHRESSSTKEVYVAESAKYGVRANRRAVAVPRRQVVAISLLTDLLG